MLQSTLRKALRRVGVAFPHLRRYSGRLGLGRLLTPGHPLERVVIDDDVVIELDLSVPYFRSLYFHHDLSADEDLRLLRRLLCPTDTVVDVGANIGYVSLVAAKHGGRVLAVEPAPDNVARLRRNLALNPRHAAKVEVEAVALAAQPGPMTLYASPAEPQKSSLGFRAGDARAVHVTVRTLDEVVQAHQLRPLAFLKIDVEGAELDVLHGGLTTLREDRPLVLCELNADMQAAMGRTCRDLIGCLEALGYVGREVEAGGGPGGLTLRPPQPDLYPPHSFRNALFMPLERLAEVERRLLAHNR